MNLEAEILKEHSKDKCNQVVAWVGKSQARFNKLFHLFTHGEYRVVQRAAWPVSYCVDAHPEFVEGHWHDIIANLEKTGMHVAVKRNILRFLQHMEIPQAFQGKILDCCFKFLESPEEALAVKVFSMSVLANLAKTYPDIKPELKLIIEDQLPYQTPGFISRAKKVMKAIEK